MTRISLTDFRREKIALCVSLSQSKAIIFQEADGKNHELWPSEMVW